MIIGVDFDNTILRCDELFHKAAVQKKLIPENTPVAKEKVRDYLRAIGREDDWTELQGTVYGDLIREAPAYDGVLSFFASCKKKSIPIFIISHKTKTPFRGPAYDLHEASRNWIRQQGFYDKAGLSPANVFFELTKQQKLQRIETQRCTHFIDDLPEFLLEKDFPAAVDRILFDPYGLHIAHGTLRRAGSWSEIQTWLLSS